MKNHKLYEPYKGQRAETVVYGALGLICLVTVGLALVASLDFAREKDRVTAAWSGNTPAGGYFRSGQSPADGRFFAPLTPLSVSNMPPGLPSWSS